MSKPFSKPLSTRLPPPKGDANKPLKAMLIDSWYDAYLGVVGARAHHRRRHEEGPEAQDDGLGRSYQIDRVGIFRPKQEMLDELGPGEVGFFTARHQRSG